MSDAEMDTAPVDNGQVAYAKSADFIEKVDAM
jgi:hypothetical protein